MANGQWGGYRAPANPAAVSGPGSLSQRTDGGPGQPQMQTTGLPYGQSGALAAAASGAPLADASDSRLPAVVPLDAPTQMPGQPVTAGSPMGPGPGPSVMAQPQGGKLTDQLQRLMQNDVGGEIENLFLYAERYGL